MESPRVAIWVSGDQLSPHNSAFAGQTPRTARVVMIESLARARQLPYHKRKLVLVYAGMRCYAAGLREAGWTVDYYAERESFEDAFGEFARDHRPRVVRMMEQSEYGVTERMSAVAAAHGLAVEVTPAVNFISKSADLTELLRGKSRVTMETFYRRMRRKTGLLMDGAEPAGGAWNFDASNRKRAPKRLDVPLPLPVAQPPEVAQAIALVERHFPDHPGRIGDFDIPVTRAGALAAAADFIDRRLARFGPYEDAMVAGEPVLFHSRLSAPLNLGLLHPLELCELAERAYRDRRAPIESAEGFVRQVLGWREYVWQVYRYGMPAYRERNALDAREPLPPFLWNGETDMACMREALHHVLSLGWAHHILRLMVIGNFALIAALDPQAMTDWFWYMFVDGYDWVMVPNVIGMTLHADGGFVGTKPYAASANYIDAMSDYCGTCRYDPKQTVGEDACPYNALYWDFLARNERRFAANQRMALVMRNWKAKDAAAKTSIRAQAAAVRERLRRGARI